MRFALIYYKEIINLLYLIHVLDLSLREVVDVLKNVQKCVDVLGGSMRGEEGAGGEEGRLLLTST